MAKYYYNGVLLPEIPAVDGYPYCAIRYDEANSRIDALYSKTNFFFTSGTIRNAAGSDYKRRIAAMADPEQWDDSSDVNYGSWTIATNRKLLWSNHDIPNGSATSTTIYFYGSEPVPAYDRKYIIRSNSTLYTVADGALVPLSDTEVSASLFRDYGVDEPPDGSLLAGLTDPEVLYWHDSTDDLPTLSLTVTGVPPVPQVVVTDAQDMSDSTILGIESVTVTASEDVLWAISFDDGATWKAHNGSQWVTLEQENSGMTAETFQNLSLEAWAEVVTSTAYRLRFVLTSPDSYVSEVVINYIN